MNWITIFVVYVLTIRSEGDHCEVERAFFLENDFWYIDQDQLKTDQGYLSNVNIHFVHKNIITENFDYYLETCNHLKSTNLRYFVLNNSVTEDIKSFLNSTEDYEFKMRFLYCFTNNPIERLCDFESYEGKKKLYVTYKLLEKLPGNKNSINLRFKEIDRQEKHIKERLVGILSMNLIRVDHYINSLSKFEEKLGGTENDVEFNFYYFKNHSECFKNLKNFIRDFKCFKLLKDDVSETSTSEMSMYKKTTLKISEFKDRLFNEFNEGLKKLNGIEIDETWKELFDECCDHLINGILNNISFPIGGKYDINYYIERFSNVILKTIKERKENNDNSNPKNEDLRFCKITSSLLFECKSLQLNIMSDLFETEYLLNHFSELLGKKVETLVDYIDVDKIVTDYHNIFENRLRLYHEFTKDSHITYPYVLPSFIDEYKTRIIDGIKINYFFGQIRGFDDGGKEVIMVKDVDYFIDESSVLYCPSVSLTMKNIQEIEIISSDNEKNTMRFKVNEYLST